MWMLIALAILIGLPVAAYQRKGFRGAYLAVAVASLIAGAGCGIMPISTPRELAQMTPDQRRGAEIIDGGSDTFITLMAASCIGGLLGACLYRHPDA